MIEKTTIINARKADLPEYLRSRGLTLKREGRQFRVPGMSGLIVAPGCWYSHTLRRGGNSLDYVIQIEGKGFREAVAALADFSSKVCNSTPTRSTSRKFQLPPENKDRSRVLSYLMNTRGIPYDILQPHLDDKRIYEARGTHNCVFVGLDCDTYEARYAFQRSSCPTSKVMFESHGSDKRYSFSLHGLSRTLLVFESVIDLLSYMSMEPGTVYKDAFFLSLGGLTGVALERFACKWCDLNEIIFCLDNDSAADAAYEGLGTQYTSYGYRVSRHKPIHKDWNAQLTRAGYFFPAPPIPWEVEM